MGIDCYSLSNDWYSLALCFSSILYVISEKVPLGIFFDLSTLDSGSRVRPFGFCDILFYMDKRELHKFIKENRYILCCIHKKIDDEKNVSPINLNSSSRYVLKTLLKKVTD